MDGPSSQLDPYTPSNGCQIVYDLLTLPTNQALMWANDLVYRVFFLFLTILVLGVLLITKIDNNGHDH